MSKVGGPSDPHRDPDVNHLSCDVAEGKVADDCLLSLGGVSETHVTAGAERRPGELWERRQRERIASRRGHVCTRFYRTDLHLLGYGFGAEES